MVSVVLGIQLVAATAWTADAVNDGPGIVILQMSDDSDTNWAVRDLQRRLSEFIVDDPYFPDRVRLVKTSDPYIAMELDGKIVIYASHGGPLGIVTGKHLTSWQTMANIVTESKAIMHLFTACSSRNIIQYGDEKSSKQLYTVPGARPAEVTNVEIVSAIMLVFGYNPTDVDEYRMYELEKAKSKIEHESKIHVMDFNQVILNELEYIDDHYSDSYSSTHKVYRFSIVETLSGVSDFSKLPLDLQDEIVHYFRLYVDDDGVPTIRLLDSLLIKYTRNYYYEAWWVIDDPPPKDEPPVNGPLPDPDPGDPSLFSAVYMTSAATSSGHWDYGPTQFSEGSYNGLVIYEGGDGYWARVVINVTANGVSIDTDGKTILESINLGQYGIRGITVSKHKVEGVWCEPVVRRNPSKTGGIWTDDCTRADYEYDATWPAYPGFNQASGSLSSNGEYITATNIPTGTNWHGPSFVRTLPSWFVVDDLGSFSANLSLLHEGDGLRLSQTRVNLYDSNKKIVASLAVYDNWGSTQSWAFKLRFSAAYFREDGSYNYLSSGDFFGVVSGLVTIRYDPQQGVYGDVPGKEESLLYAQNQINHNRLVKYIVIQSYRYASYDEHNERIYGIDLNYAGSEYSVYHDSCSGPVEFVKDLDFGWGTSADGDLVSPSGSSYMQITSIPSTPSGWHGPNYVHQLERPFRLYQLEEFSVIGEMIQTTSSRMGKTYIGLFDDMGNLALLLFWGDAWAGSMKTYFYSCFYPQGGSGVSQFSGYSYSTDSWEGKLWWDPWQGGDGAIYSSIDGNTISQPWEVNNASRVIKTIVLLGYRYSSYTLADMRIHDINLVCDLNENKPASAPPVEDGQSDGSDQTMSPQIQAKADAQLTGALACVATYWTGWWPTLHIVASHASLSTPLMHFSVDLVGNTEVIETNDAGATMDDFNNALLFGVFATVVALQLFGLHLISVAAETIPATGWWGVAAVLITMGLIIGYVWYMTHQFVDNGLKSAGSTAYWFLAMTFALLLVASGLKVFGGVIGIGAMKLFSRIWPVGVAFGPSGAEAPKGGIWTSIVFILMAVAFYLMFLHFLSYP